MSADNHNSIVIAWMAKFFAQLESDWHHRELPGGAQPKTPEELHAAFLSLAEFYDVELRESQFTGQPAVMVRNKALHAMVASMEARA
jgi:hypothetical protein